MYKQLFKKMEPYKETQQEIDVLSLGISEEILKEFCYSGLVSSYFIDFLLKNMDKFSKWQYSKIGIYATFCSGIILEFFFLFIERKAFEEEIANDKELQSKETTNSHICGDCCTDKCTWTPPDDYDSECRLEDMRQSCEI